MQLFHPNTAKTLNKRFHFDLNNNDHQTQHPNKPKTWEEIIQTLEILHARPRMNWLQSNKLAALSVYKCLFLNPNLDYIFSKTKPAILG